MKRPFAVIGFTYLFAQLLAVVCGLRISLVLCVSFALSAVALFLLFRDLSSALKTTIISMLISTAVAFGAYSVYNIAAVLPAEYLEGRTAVVKGTVAEPIYESNGRYYCIIETDSVSLIKAPQRVRMRLSSKTSTEAHVSDRITANVIFNSSSRSTRGRFNLMSDGVVATAYLSINTEVDLQPGKQTLYSRIAMARDSVAMTVDRLYDKPLAAALTGLMIGDKSKLDVGTVRDFRLCGLSHYLAVSGMHLSIIVSFLMALLRSFMIPHRLRCLLLIPCVVLIMAFTGFPASIRRAGVMTILMLLSQVVRRDYDSVNALGLSLLLICLFQPYAAADIGLWLSAASTMGILLLYNPVRKKLAFALFRQKRQVSLKDRFAFSLLKLLLFFAGGFLMSLTAGVFAIPISMLYFGEVSLISPFCNMLCSFPSTVFLITGALSVAFSFVPIVGGLLSAIVRVPAWLCGKLMLWIIHAFASIPGAGVSVNYDFIPVFIVSVLFLALTYAVLKNRIESKNVFMKSCAFALAVVFSLGVISEGIADRCMSEICIGSVDDGVAVYARAGGKCVMVGAGGDNYELSQLGYSLINSNTNRLDALFLPEESPKLMSGARSTIELLRPDNVYLPDFGSLSEAAAFAASQLGSQIYPIASSEWSTKDNRLSAKCYIDDSGKSWCYVRNNRLSVLICPEEGDCTVLPEDISRPDIAVVQSYRLANITKLGALAVIVSADERVCADSALKLRYRGIEHVYTTAADGSIRITPGRNEKIIIGRAEYAGY